MSDDSPQVRSDSLKAQYNRNASVCWVEQGEPVFRAWVEGGLIAGFSH